MRKLFLAMVVAAVAVAGFSVISQAGTGRGGTEWTFEFTKNTTSTATGTDSLIKPAYTKADGTLAETKKTTIVFPTGTSFDTAVPPRCKASGRDIQNTNGEVCKRAQIGSGDALARVGQATFAAVLKAYNKKNGIWFLVITCEFGTGPGQANETCKPAEGQTFPLEGTLKYTDRARTKPILVVPTPQTLLDGNIIITSFHLETCTGTFAKKCKKTVTVNGKRVVRAFTITPKRCRGSWKSAAKIQYDGEPGQTISDTQACRS